MVVELSSKLVQILEGDAVLELVIGRVSVYELQDVLLEEGVDLEGLFRDLLHQDGRGCVGGERKVGGVLRELVVQAGERVGRLQVSDGVSSVAEV